MEAAVACWSPDAVMAGADGSVIRGRDALRERFAQLVAAGASFAIDVDELVEGDGVALAATRLTMRLGDGEPLRFRGSVVYVRTGVGWRIAVDRVTAA